MALGPPTAARDPDGAREIEGMEVLRVVEFEWVKEFEWWSVGALEVRKPACRRAVTEEVEKVVLGNVVVRVLASRQLRNSSRGVSACTRSPGSYTPATYQLRTDPNHVRPQSR